MRNKKYMENPIKNKVVDNENERENKEVAPDFKKIFEEKLDNIEPVTGEDAIGLNSWYKGLNIIGIRKEVPAVFFDPQNLANHVTLTDVWIEDPKNLDGCFK